MAYGSQNAVVLEVRDGDSKFVEKEWKDFMKTYGKLKKVKKSKEMIAENVRISQVKGTESFNLYSAVKQQNTTTQLVVWVEFGADGFMNSDEHPDEYEGLTEMLTDFEFTVRKNRVL